MTRTSCWIATVDRGDAEPDLAAAYDEVCRGEGSVHNMYQAFASRPDLLVLADRFYRALLHSPRRSLEDWVQELVATHVAILCGIPRQQWRDSRKPNFDRPGAVQRQRQSASEQAMTRINRHRAPPE